MSVYLARMPRLADTLPPCPKSVLSKNALAYFINEIAGEKEERLPIILLGIELEKSSKTPNVAAYKISKNCLCN